MSNFPLYDNIIQKLEDAGQSPDTPITIDEKHTFIDFVKASDQNVHEFIYMLMKVHQLKFDTTSSTNLPFNGKEQKCGLKFDMDALSHHLQRVLYEFSKIKS